MNSSPKHKVLLLSTSLLVDRVFMYTDLVKRLADSGSVEIWAASALNEEFRQTWQDVPAEVRSFPEIGPFREFPYNYLRRLNEFAWDFRQKVPSRMSMYEHVRRRTMRGRIKILRPLARVVTATHTERFLEDQLEKMMLGFDRSAEGSARLAELRPDVVVSTGPFQFEQPGLVGAAQKLGIPTLAYIPSWDNVTTKNRLVFKYDGYIVWNEHTRRELEEFYPAAREKPIYVVGAPQFDIFSQPAFKSTRSEFCAGQNLDPQLPIILYAIGSPNFLQEHHGAVEFAKRVAAGKLGDVQLLVRPHPIHDNAEMAELFGSFGPRVRLQQNPNAGKSLTLRSQDEGQITEWVSTFLHADVVINLSSTVTIDAAIFDKPVVNLDFDPQPGARDQQLIKEVNHSWNHFKPIAESGGVWLVNNFDEMETAVKGYLADPSLHRDARRNIVAHVCGFIDGNCGARMADAITEFIAGRKSN